MNETNKLKQEIEEYLTKDYCCEFKKECKDGVRIRCSEYEAKLYLLLRFAEPREKQIEKAKYTLKKIIETVQNDNISSYGDRLVKIYDFVNECLTELEK